MLASAVATGNLRILLNTSPDAAVTDHDYITSITCQSTNTGERIQLQARMFIDASEEGDLLAISGTEYVIGAESQKQTGEPHAPKKADPANIQALTHCFAIDHLEGEDHTIDRPEMYDFWKNHTPALDPPWPGPILSLDYSNPRTLVPKTLSFVPPGRTTPAPETETLNLWLYRRMIDRSNFAPERLYAGKYHRCNSRRTENKTYTRPNHFMILWVLATTIWTSIQALEVTTILIWIAYLSRSPWAP